RQPTCNEQFVDPEFAVFLLWRIAHTDGDPKALDRLFDRQARLSQAMIVDEDAQPSGLDLHGEQMPAGDGFPGMESLFHVNAGIPGVIDDEGRSGFARDLGDHFQRPAQALRRRRNVEVQPERAVDYRRSPFPRRALPRLIEQQAGFAEVSSLLSQSGFSLDVPRCHRPLKIVVYDWQRV